MLIQILIQIFERDLKKLKNEIDQYQNEGNLWHVANNISNSAGNLCLHLIGNLNTYIGAELGKSDYIRNRDLEFSLKDVSKNELLEKIDSTIEMIQKTLQNIAASELQKDFPVLVFKEKTSIEFMLVHLATHLTYHLGQINYHRRLLDI